MRIRDLRISHENLRICDLRNGTADRSSAKRFNLDVKKLFLFQWKPRFARITRLSPVAGMCFFAFVNSYMTIVCTISINKRFRNSRTYVRVYRFFQILKAFWGI
jgi:hypothetical protein